MKSKIFNKNDLIFYYQAFPFPKKQISEDAMVHKDFILLEEGEEPELANQPNKRGKYSGCFVIEEELEKIKGQNLKKPSQNIKGPNKMPYKNKWKKNQQEENSNSSGFFDEFKGRTDEKQVSQFKRNLSNSESTEGSISIIGSILIDHLPKDPNRHIKIKAPVSPKERLISDYNSDHKESKEVANSEVVTSSIKTTTISADNFFENADKILSRNLPVNSTPNVIENKAVESNQDKDITNAKNTPILNEEFNIKDIYKVNEFLQYSKEEPLWYIFHPTAKSSFGPITSINIEEMFNGKMLLEKSEIRFIDVYNFRNKKPFSFFALKEISSNKFLDDIDISSLLRVAVNIMSKEKDISIKKPDNKISGVIYESNSISTNKSLDVNLTQSKTNTGGITNLENTWLSDKRSEIILNQPQTTKINNTEEIYSSESIYNISSHGHNEHNLQAYRDYTNQGQDRVENHGGKKFKSKPADFNGRLDAKLEMDDGDHSNNQMKSQNKNQYYHNPGKDTRPNQQFNYNNDYNYKYDHSYENEGEYYNNYGRNQRNNWKNK